MRIVVPPALEGERVDRAVAAVTALPRSQVAELVEDHRVSVDGRPVRSRSRRLVSGEVVEVEITGLAPEVSVEADAGLVVTVVHEDDQVVVVDKAPGVVVHPGRGNRAGTLVNGLLARYPDLSAVGPPGRPGIVHRLDKGTSGLLVVARTPEARQSLVRQLSEHGVERSYRALVIGKVASASGVIDAPIGRSGRDRTAMAVTGGGRPARTTYVVERRFASPVEATLLRCRLETGRTHQVRVHMSAIGHPIAGDDRYGPRAREARALLLRRPFLHAERLAFTHPATGERLELRSPLPEDLRGTLNVLS